MSPYFSVLWVICPHFSKTLAEHWGHRESITGACVEQTYRVHPSEFVFQKSHAIASDFCGMQTHDEYSTRRCQQFEHSILEMLLKGFLRHNQIKYLMYDKMVKNFTIPQSFAPNSRSFNSNSISIPTLELELELSYNSNSKLNWPKPCLHNTVLC